MWEISDNSLDLWSQVDTNKKVAALWPNNADGNAYRDLLRSADGGEGLYPG